MRDDLFNSKHAQGKRQLRMVYGSIATLIALLAVALIVCAAATVPWLETDGDVVNHASIEGVDQPVVYLSGGEVPVEPLRLRCSSDTPLVSSASTDTCQRAVGAVEFLAPNDDGDNIDHVRLAEAPWPLRYVNDKTAEVTVERLGSSAGITILPNSSSDVIQAVPALTDTCEVYLEIDDSTCAGYDVYVDGVYQLTEGQGGTPDGYCALYVTEGWHLIELRQNGCSTSETANFSCGYSYIWVGMPADWCNCNESACTNPPTVQFDKTTYYEGDTVNVTVSLANSSVYYEFKDCSSVLRDAGYLNSSGVLTYTIPNGSTSSCCSWSLCFYWNESTQSLGYGSGSAYQCSKCYAFYVCPETCLVYNEVIDATCAGYDVYVDSVYQFTEGQDGTPDGYCAFYVTEGNHTIEIRKGGCSASVYHYFECGVQHQWVSMPADWCNCNESECTNPPTVQFDKTTYYEGDTVNVTVSLANSSVYYEIKDCSGVLRDAGYLNSSGVLNYTIPNGSTPSCCSWSLCFYWNESTQSPGYGSGSAYQCSKCYSFTVCPETCWVYNEIIDETCAGYDVYVDGGYQLTEGQGETQDGYCAFYVPEGNHTIELRKEGCSA